IVPVVCGSGRRPRPTTATASTTAATTTRAARTIRVRRSLRAVLVVTVRAYVSSRRILVDEMPTYAYACTECGHQFDVVQSFSEDSLTTCPECSGRLRKQFNAVGVVFKGGGFYKTDSRSGSGSDSGSGSGESGQSSSN